MKQVDQTIQKFRLPKVGQIGIVVRNMGAVLPQYARLLNVNPWFRSKTVEQEVTYRGKKISMDLDLLLGYSGRMEVELIGVGSEEENIYTEVLRKGGGLHHLGFFVSDFDRRMLTLKNTGVKVLQQGRIATGGGSITQYAYLNTVEQCGVILELIESKLKGRIPVPHTKFMMGIGSLTGDVEKLRF